MLDALGAFLLYFGIGAALGFVLYLGSLIVRMYRNQRSLPAWRCSSCHTIHDLGMVKLADKKISCPLCGSAVKATLI